MTYPASVRRPSVDGDIQELFTRVRALEANPSSSGVDGPWITVGTPGVDGVDALIAANPAPFNSSPWVPFENGWTHDDPTSLDEGPVQFLLTLNGWVQMRGGFTGGADGTVVFTLPSGYRPSINQPFDIALQGSTAASAKVIAQADGGVLYVTSE